MSRSIERQAQSGQAIVETALLLPLLVFLLLAVGFVGFAIAERQNVVIAARFAARSAAMNSMTSSADRLLGKGILTEAGSTANRERYARAALGGRRTVSVTGPSWRYESVAPHAHFTNTQVLGTLGRAYLAKNGKFGMGFVMYGQRVTSKGQWLDGIGSAVNEASKPFKGGKIWNKVGVSAEAYMPGELPLHAPGNAGLLDMNPWIKERLVEP